MCHAIIMADVLPVMVSRKKPRTDLWLIYEARFPLHFHVRGKGVVVGRSCIWLPASGLNSKLNFRQEVYSGFSE